MAAFGDILACFTVKLQRVEIRTENGSQVFLLIYLTSATFEARDAQECMGLEQIVKIGYNETRKFIV